MIKRQRVRLHPLLFLLAASVCAAAGLRAQAPTRAETVSVESGTLRLKGLLWRPPGTGPFPAILFNHGNHVDSSHVPILASGQLAPAFTRHGWIILVLFRRGEGLSHDQGVPLTDAVARERATAGEDAADKLRDRLLVTEQLDDVMAGLAYLRSRPDVAPDQVAIAGHSMGGMLSIYAAARDSSLRAMIDFAGAELTWNAEATRTSLIEVANRLNVPAMFIHAANGNPAPGQALAAVMQQRGRPHELRIYPSFGASKQQAHQFVFLATPQWEPDVFEFLKRAMARQPHND